MIRDDLSSLFAYNRWADARMIEALRRLSPEDYAREPLPGWASIRSTIVHMADATTIWARRLDGQPVTTRRGEDDVPTLDAVVQLLDEGNRAFERLVAGLTPEQLASIWNYQNFQGQSCRVPLWAVYRHVVNHATYHRGQVSAKLKRLGVDPPSIDFVFWAIAETPQG